MSNDHPSENQNAGYKKPPAHSQFRRGHSGNKKGRPKGRRSFKTDLREELDEVVSARQNGREIFVTKQRLIIKAWVDRAVKGDMRAVNALSALCIRLFESEEQQKQEDVLAPDDEKILKDFFDKEVTKRTTAQPKNDETKFDDSQLNQISNEE